MTNTSTTASQVQQATDVLHWAQLYDKPAITACQARVQQATSNHKWQRMYGHKPQRS